jgi:hypothetical protein
VIEPVLVLRSQINDTDWNTLIERSGYSIPYASTWYLDCVSPQWQALVWPSSSDYHIILPLPVRKKWGMQVIQQPLFCQFLGFFSISEITAYNVRDFLKVLNSHFGYISSYAFHPECFSLVHPLLSESTDLSFDIQATHYLGVKSNKNTIRSNYSKDRLLNLKRSFGWDWEIKDSVEIEPLLTLFQKNHEQSIHGGVNKDAHAQLHRLFLEGKKKGYLKLQYAVRQNTIHAGCLFFKYLDRTIYLFNAADLTGRKGNARTYLLDSYLQSMDLTGTFDFESPDIDSIASFYESFGAKRHEYITIKKNKLPFPFRQLQEWRKRWLTTT